MSINTPKNIIVTKYSGPRRAHINPRTTACARYIWDKASKKFVPANQPARDADERRAKEST